MCGSWIYRISRLGVQTGHMSRQQCRTRSPPDATHHAPPRRPALSNPYIIKGINLLTLPTNLLRPLSHRHKRRYLLSKMLRVPFMQGEISRRIIRSLTLRVLDARNERVARAPSPSGLRHGLVQVLLAVPGIQVGVAVFGGFHGA